MIEATAATAVDGRRELAALADAVLLGDGLAASRGLWIESWRAAARGLVADASSTAPYAVWRRRIGAALERGAADGSVPAQASLDDAVDACIAVLDGFAIRIALGLDEDVRRARRLAGTAIDAILDGR